MKGSFERLRSSMALLGSLAVAIGATMLCTTALAQYQGRGAPPVWRGDIARFHEHDWGVWRGGRWLHARHEGRLGWWWVVGGVWYFYPSPVYPYPNPWEPPVLLVPPADVAPAVPATQYWYYCDASRRYYPYAATCAGGWKQVPAMPADTPAAAPK
jgi:hypothetical protein